jgi:hypothetical protein
MNLEQLKSKISYKWKIQNFNKTKTKAQCVAYIDARDVMDILDKAVGPENWQDEYKLLGDKVMGGIGIDVNQDKNFIWKWDTGTESSYEAEKGQISDAFKRAGVKWGIGRFLYDMDFKWVNVVNGYPVTKSGDRIYDLTDYIENNYGK